MAIEPRQTTSLKVAEIQAEIDAAKPGDVLHLPAGQIRGRLVIDKPITIRGAGADRTVLDANRRGTAIAVDAEGGEVRIEEMSITNGNSSQGGGMSIDNGAEVYVTGCTFERNSATSGCGGAIAIDYGFLSINECTLFENRAVVGGAIFIGGQAKAEISASIVAENAAIKGGAIAIVDGADVEVWTCRVEENEAECEGHHIFTYGTRRNRPRIVLSNALLTAADSAGLPISNHPRFKAEMVIDNSTLGRDLMPAFLVG